LNVVGTFEKTVAAKSLSVLGSHGVQGTVFLRTHSFRAFFLAPLPAGSQNATSAATAKLFSILPEGATGRFWPIADVRVKPIF
jgi:hypothetical protein